MGRVRKFLKGLFFGVNGLKGGTPSAYFYAEPMEDIIAGQFVVTVMASDVVATDSKPAKTAKSPPKDHTKKRSSK